jgi:hypothetical protein
VFESIIASSFLRFLASFISIIIFFSFSLLFVAIKICGIYRALVFDLIVLLSFENFKFSLWSSSISNDSYALGRVN